MQSLETKSSRPRPKSFETEARPETFETEAATSKDGSRDASRDRDQVSRLHHCELLQRQDAKLANTLFCDWAFCVAITWQQIFKGSLQVTVVACTVDVGGLPHATVERSHLGW